MRISQTALLIICVVASTALQGYAAPASINARRSVITPADSSPNRKQVSNACARLPLSFEANNGQADPKVKFLMRGEGFTFLLSPAEAIINLRGSTPSDVGLRDERLTGSLRTRETSQSHIRDARSAFLRMKLEGSNALAEMKGREQLPGKSNYIHGRDPKNWRTDIPVYAKIEQKNVYDGIDILYYGNQQQLEYDFIVAPGASPDRIKLRFDGAERIRIDSNGDLVLSTAVGELRQKRPYAYQESGDGRQDIAARYVIKGKHKVGLRVGRYDSRKTLVIDPVLIYSSYFSGVFTEGRAVAVDFAGNSYVAGWTDSRILNVTANAFQKEKQSPQELGEDAFVMKLNASGALVYCTYLGGKRDDEALAIAVDSKGNAYVTGYTESPNFPTTPGAFQAEKIGFEGVFVAKLNASGTGLVYSTYLGSESEALGIAVDDAGSAFVVGATSNEDFPTTEDAFQPKLDSSAHSFFSDAFVTKFSADGSRLIYSTFLGGFYNDGATGITVDDGGNAYVTGYTDSGDDIVTFGAFRSLGFSGDVFVAKLNPKGEALVYLAAFGGGDEDYSSGIAVDAEGNAYITGKTFSLDFPVSQAFQGKLTSGGLLKSKGGADWVSLDSELAVVDEGIFSGTIVKALAADPHSAAIVYAGTYWFGHNSVSKSTDGGATWSLTRLPNEIAFITVDPQNNSTVYAGVHRFDYTQGQLFKSTDGGASWSPTSLSFADTGISCLVVDPQNSSTLYAGTSEDRFGFQFDTGQGVFKSTDGGATWASVNAGLSDLNISAVVIDPQMPSTLYTATHLGLFKSTDGGNNWAQSKITSLVIALAADPQTPGTLYAGARPNFKSVDLDDGRGNPRRRKVSGLDGPGGLIKSTDGGETWREINNGLDWFYNHYLISFDPQSSSTLYLGTFDGVFKSVDGGNNWAATGFRESDVKALAVTKSGELYLSNEATTDAFVAKLNATGKALTYSTYVGGINADSGAAIAVDSSGNAYVAGTTRSINFPVTPDALQPVYARGGSQYPDDGFVFVLDAKGALTYSTFIGGNDEDDAYGLALNSRGEIFLTGQTWSGDFPTLNPFQGALAENSGFIIKLGEATEASTHPKVTGASVSGKKLIVSGTNFGQGAVIVLDGEEQRTINDALNPSSVLISKKAGKKVKTGQPVVIRVKNSTGTMSDEYSFVRQ